MLTATAQLQINQEPTLMDKLNPQHIKITEQIVSNKATAPKPARIEQTTHQVNFVLDFDAETQDAYGIVLVNQDGMLTNRNIGLRNLQYGSNNASVPEGTYDVVTIFTEYQNKGTAAQEIHHDLFVIHEQVTIDQDMQLDFSAAEAKNHIHIQMLNNGGEPVVCPTYSRSEDWQMTMIEPGNTLYANYLKKVFCKDYGEVISGDVTSFYSTVQVGDYLIDYQCLSDFYVNDVSDRYAFGTYCMTVDLDFNVYTSYKEVQGASGDVTLANDPSKFKLYENQVEVPQDTEQVVTDQFAMLLFNNNNNIISKVSFSLMNNIVEETGIARFYIDAGADESAVGYVPYVARNQLLTTVHYYDEWSSVYFASYVIQTTPITCVNNDVVLANWLNDLDNGRIDDLDLEWDESEQTLKMYPYSPSHPAFTYPIERMKGKWGNSSPVLITNPRQYEFSYTYNDEVGNPMTFNGIRNELKYQYRGRYGEITSDHRRNAHVTMKLDGECVYDGPGFLEEHHFEEMYTSMDFLAQFPELFSGVVDATITTEAVKVDDMPGSNKAQLHYTAGAEDETPPTMTMLHFKDSNGDVTDRFATADDGTVEFSAADFNFFYTPDGDCSYFRHAPETVEVSYSPYGEDNWNELPVEELPEYYWPVMGWFYRGSLAGVTGQAEKGWFDLKFRLEDAAGNWQEQVVSPAFRIDDLAYSSVATVGSGNAHEVARYNLAGQRVDTSHQGVTIIKMSDGTARKVIN
jgi:hypothetical protein